MKSPQVGFKPFCITCQFFSTCEEVPVIDNKNNKVELDEFDRKMNSDTLLHEPSEESSDLLQPNDYSEEAKTDENSKPFNSERLDRIAKARPALKHVMAFLDLKVPAAELKRLKSIPNPPSAHHHLIGITDYEVIIGDAILTEEMFHTKLGLDLLKNMTALMGSELLGAVLLEKLISIYGDQPELLIKEVLGALGGMPRS